MFRSRGAFPYEWCIALSGAVEVALTPWLPLAPFSGVAMHWMRWFGDAFFDGRLALAAHEPSPVALLPVIGATALALPLLYVVMQAHRRSRVAMGFAWASAVLLASLAGLEIAGSLLASAPWLDVGRIALTCAVGLALGGLGFGLRKTAARPKWLIPTLGWILLCSGLCLASFVLIPLGLLGLLVSYLVLTVVLLRREHRPSRSATAA